MYGQVFQICLFGCTVNQCKKTGPATISSGLNGIRLTVSCYGTVLNLYGAIHDAFTTVAVMGKTYAVLPAFGLLALPAKIENTPLLM